MIGERDWSYETALMWYDFFKQKIVAINELLTDFYVELFMRDFNKLIDTFSDLIFQEGSIFTMENSGRLRFIFREAIHNGNYDLVDKLSDNITIPNHPEIMALIGVEDEDVEYANKTGHPEIAELLSSRL